MVHSKATVDEFNEICIREDKCCEDNFCFEVLTHEFFDFTENVCFYCLSFFVRFGFLRSSLYSWKSYIHNWIVWLISKNVKDAVFMNSGEKMQALVIDKNESFKKNYAVIFNRGTTIYHCCQKLL